MEQTDQHYAPLTVRETFDFAAWCQGTGYRRGEFPPFLYVVYEAHVPALGGTFTYPCAVVYQ